jgi:hypothetical protein
MFNNVKMGNQLMNNQLMTRFYELGAFKLEDIALYVKPANSIDKSYYNKFYEVFDKVYKENPKEFKMMINIFIGTLAKMHNNTYQTAISSCKDIINFLKDNNVSFSEMRDFDKTLYIYKKRHESELYMNNKPINVDIVLQGTLRLLELSRKFERTDILGYKVDAIYLEPTVDTSGITSSYKLNNGWGGYTFEHGKFITETIEKEPYINHNLLKESFDMSRVDNDILDRGLLSGPPGTGKSYLLINTIIPYLKQIKSEFVLLAPTHKAASNLIEKGLECNTVASFLAKNEKETQNMFINRLAEKYHDKTIIIDEIYLISKSDLTILYMIYKKILLFLLTILTLVLKITLMLL